MARLKHGASVLNLKLYRVFNTMKQRCGNPGHPMFSVYGDRGIKICREWLENPRTFVEWALCNGYVEGLTIDRIDVHGIYAPANCRWVPLKAQGRNKQYHRMISYDGQVRCLAEWAEITGIPAPNLAVRLDRCGMSVEVAFTKPVVPRRNRYSVDGETLTAGMLATRLGVSRSYVYRHYEPMELAS